MTRLPREAYTVGWVCALPVELAAALEMLDEEHEDLERDNYDDNLYCLGSIAEHNIVIFCLPAGDIGNRSAFAAMSRMKVTFKSIRFSLMVGIGGGVPSAETDIRLGDVVVSRPYQRLGGVVQHAFRKATASEFILTGSFLPPRILLDAVSRVQANELQGRSKISEYVSEMSRIPKFRREEAGPDILFEAEYDHEGGYTCDNCREDRQLARPVRVSEEEVVVHYGTIASGSQVIRTASLRDWLSSSLGGILCFEIEAAGLLNIFPCLVIRGICDYSDSHKNKKWQPYAAATAAAYAKELLTLIPPVNETRTRILEKTIPITRKMGKHIQGRPISKDRSDHNDAESFRDSIYGTMSRTASLQAALSLPGVREAMLEILIKNDSLQPSGTNAVEALNVETFVASFKNLLETFSQKLRQEAEHKEQRAATFVFWHYATYAARSAWEYWSGGDESGWAKLLARLPERKMELDFALQRVASRTEPEDGANDDDGINNEREDSETELQHPVHLKRLEDFITNSIAFQDLRRNLGNLSAIEERQREEEERQREEEERQREEEERQREEEEQWRLQEWERVAREGEESRIHYEQRRQRHEAEKEAPRRLEQEQAQSNNEAGQMRSYWRFVFTRSLVTAIQDVCKKTGEHVAGTRLSWWPLSEPEEALKANYTRVYSQPLIDSSHRNLSFHDDIPSSLADKLFHGLAAARNMASETRWETLRHEAVFLEGTTLMRLLCNKHRPSPMNENEAQETELATKDASDGSEQAPSSRSTVKVEQPSAGIDGRGTEMKDVSAGMASDVSMDNRKKDPNDDENVKHLASEEGENKLEDTKSVLFLSLDLLTNDSRACSVDVGADDLKTMANLRDSYKALQSSFLWNRKRPVGVKFYRFRSFLYKSERRHHIQLHRDKERYPPKDDGNYD